LVLSAHWFLLQLLVMPGWQLPMRSHAGAEVATPLWQLDLPQGTVVSGKAQAVRLVPSHIPLQALPSPAHCVRGARGAPITFTQVPFWFVSPHASH
jgi:hypothetical protein